MPDRRVARTRQIDVENLFDTSRPASHDRHAIGQKDGLVDAMGNEHHRGCALLPDAEQFLLQRLACLRIERAKGLVHQQDFGAVGEYPGNRHALTHAARQLMRIVIGEIEQADKLKEPFRLAAPLRAGNAANLQAGLDVLAHGPPRKQRVALEHQPELLARGAHRLAVDAHAT
jgi:hypothetical protein